MNATELFENAMDWLRQHYEAFRFFTERDIVWTVQKQMMEAIDETRLPYCVLNDYTILGRVRADLVIISGNSVVVAVEFKYEPSHARSSRRNGDIWHTKIKPSVVFWTVPGASKDSSVEKDVQRVRQYVDEGKANAAYSVFIDEGGYFHERQDALHDSEWRDWGNGRWVLWSQT